MISPAPAGNAMYIFEGAFESQQPVAIAIMDAGRPQIFPIVGGRAAEDLKESLARFVEAKAHGRTFLSKSTTRGIALVPLPRGEMPRVALDSGGAHVWLSQGASVSFSAGSLEVTMPRTLPSLPQTRINFANVIGPGHQSRMNISVNDKNITLRQGPIWDGLEQLVLLPALRQAGRAAVIVAGAPGKTQGTPDYIAFVSNISRNLINDTVSQPCVNLTRRIALSTKAGQTGRPTTYA